VSDGATRRRPSAGQSRQRRKGAPRGGRHGLSRPPAAMVGDDLAIEQRIALRTAVPARRPITATGPLGISREAEFAYIRSDMRRLLIIAGLLFALMLVLLVFVSR
jgi:hypothetical protein